MSRNLRQLVDLFFPNDCVGVEIGVGKAVTAQHLLDNIDRLKLYCIDPYTDRDNRYDRISELLGKYDNCTFLRMTSHDASSIVPDDLDFIFIDGDHSYEGVLLDLYDWVPKIKSGGLLSGHDWTSLKRGVPLAGREYFGKNQHLFEPLYSEEKLAQLEEMGLCFKIGGRGGIIHKQKYSSFSFWWRIKK